MPVILLVWSVAGLALAGTRPWVLDGLVVTAGVYLAWHYTGQAWGLMATFSFLDGRPFATKERLLVRGGLRLLLAFHVVFFARAFLGQAAGVPEGLRRASGELYPVAAAGLAVSALLGVIGLTIQSRRLGGRPALRVVVPWIAVHLWYVLLLRHPNALFWVQIAHAVQYLVFPGRVELNRFRASGRPGRAWVHMAAYAVVLVLVGITVVELLGHALDPAFVAAFGPGAKGKATLVVLNCLNIHHYFTDGSVWKISDPAVRKDLMAHVA